MGHVFLGPGAVATDGQRARRGWGPAAGDDADGAEIEVLRYLARGLSKKQIATTMHLSVKTVDRHTANLMNKLDIHDRVELTRYAIREGIAEP